MYTFVYMSRRLICLKHPVLAATDYSLFFCKASCMHSYRGYNFGSVPSSCLRLKSRTIVGRFCKRQSISTKTTQIKSTPSVHISKTVGVDPNRGVCPGG